MIHEKARTQNRTRNIKHGELTTTGWEWTKKRVHIWKLGSEPDKKEKKPWPEERKASG